MYKWNIVTSSGGSSVSQNKLQQLIFEYIYIPKYFKSNSIGRILFFRNSHPIELLLT